MKRLCLGLVVALGLSAGIAQAQKKGDPPKKDPQAENIEKAKALYQQGEDHFKVGEFEQALESYKEAYKLSHLSGFLLNMGQCQVKLGQYEEAKHSYEALLHEDPNTPYRADVEQKIAEMDRLIAEEKAKQEAASQAVLAASQPIVIIEEPPKKKGLLIGGIAGGIVLGGSALTLFLLTRDGDLPPPVPIPGSELGTFDSF